MSGIEDWGAHRGAWLLGALMAFATLAAAQAQPPAKPQGEPPVFETPPEEHLLGDWGGIRSGLAGDGLTLSLEYKGEVAGNFSGGVDRGGDYAHLVTLKGDMDWSKLTDAKGFSTHVAFSNFAGDSLSATHLADKLLAVQDAYIPGHRVGVRLDWAYLQQSLFDGKLDLAAGRIPVHLDFAKNPDLYCQFLSTAICGGPHTLPAQAAFTDLPFSTWGGRAKLEFGHSVYGLAGIYEVNPHQGGPTGFDWSTRHATGVLAPVELGFEPKLGGGNLPGHYKLGYMYDSSRYADLLAGPDGAPFPLTGLSAARHRADPTVYALADQMLLRHGKGPSNGLVVMVGAVRADPSTFYLSNLEFAGLTDQGIVKARPDDTLGLLVARAEVSDDLAATQALDQALDLPIAQGAPGPQTREWIVEANYTVHVAKGLSLTPDIQHVDRPDASRAIPSVWVWGLRTDVHF